MALPLDDGGSYSISGSKSWITNGFEAKSCILFATTDKAKKHKGISCFIVPMPIQGKFLIIYCAHAHSR